MESSDHIQEDLVFAFSDVAKHIFTQIQETVQEETQQSPEPRFLSGLTGGYGGCNDAFSGFGFLAFLLALLDLILELQEDPMAGRKRREAPDGGVINPWESALVQEAGMAAYAMYRGYLNALAVEDGGCAKRFLCEAAEEAAQAGSLGKMIANVASVNAGGWLEHSNRTLYAGVGAAGVEGSSAAEPGRCGQLFSQCFNLPTTYRHPKLNDT